MRNELSNLRQGSLMSRVGRPDVDLALARESGKAFNLHRENVGKRCKDSLIITPDQSIRAVSGRRG
jgi:hypothetical protein